MKILANKYPLYLFISSKSHLKFLYFINIRLYYFIDWISQVYKVFIQFLPKILFIQRPAKDNEDDLDKPPDGVLTEVFDVPDYVDYGSRYPTDFDIPSLPPSRYDVSNMGW